MNRCLFLCFIAVGCRPPHAPPAEAIPPSARQVVVVETGADRRQAKVTGWDRVGDAWRVAVPTRPGVVGREGIAPIGEKREGDGRTPAGVFAIGPAFGFAASLDTGLSYFQATDRDFWIDAPDSPDYNRRVVGDVPVVSHEKLRTDGDEYKMAAVIGYNTRDVVPGRGSAIFLHVWRGPDSPTQGCVALAEPDVARFLNWLNKQRHPVIAISPAQDHSEHRNASRD